MSVTRKRVFNLPLSAVPAMAASARADLLAEERKRMTRRARELLIDVYEEALFSWSAIITQPHHRVSFCKLVDVKCMCVRSVGSGNSHVLRIKQGCTSWGAIYSSVRSLCKLTRTASLYLWFDVPGIPILPNENSSNLLIAKHNLLVKKEDVWRTVCWLAFEKKQRPRFEWLAHLQTLGLVIHEDEDSEQP